MAFEIALPSRSTMAMDILAGSELSLPLPPKIDPKNEAMAIGTANVRMTARRSLKNSCRSLRTSATNAAISPSNSFR